MYPNDKVTSGTTAKASTTAAAVELIPASGAEATFCHVRIQNHGANPLFFALDGGAADESWEYLAAGDIFNDDYVMVSGAIVAKRIGAADFGSVYASRW